MVEYTLKIQGIPLKYERIKAERKEYNYCDAEGKELDKKKTEEYAEVDERYKYVYKDSGERYEGKTYKKIDGEPRKSFSKTKEISKEEYEIESETEARDLASEKFYKVRVPEAFEDIVEEGEAIKFPFAHSGYKQYIAYIHRYGSGWIMRLGRVYLSDSIEQDEAEVEPEAEITEEPESVKEPEKMVEV